MSPWYYLPDIFSSSSGPAKENNARTGQVYCTTEHHEQARGEAEHRSGNQRLGEQPILLGGALSTGQDDILRDQDHFYSIDTIVGPNNEAGAVPKSESVTDVKRMRSRDRRETRDSGNLNTGDRTQRDQFEDLRTRIQTLEWEKMYVRKELDVSRRESREMENKHWGVRRENGDLRRELDFTHQRGAEITSHYECQKQELNAVKEQLHRVEAQHEITCYQLKEKTTELQSAWLFINQADALSGAEVIAMANALNAEILQAAAFMADSLDFTRAHQPKMEEVSGAKLMIGNELIQALLSREVHNEHEFDPTLVQLALQVCLVGCCKNITQSWTFREDNILKDVYKIILAREKQSAAGRWRSMTQSHATAPESSAWCLQWLVDSVVKVLVLAGYSPQDTNAFPASFQERLSIISDLALQLRTAIGQQVTSMDIIPIIAESGSAFNPNAMDNTYTEEKGVSEKNKAGELVAGSTELGLISRVKVVDGIQETMMLKPKVILCSALKD